MRYYFLIICCFQLMFVTNYSFGQSANDSVNFQKDSIPLSLEELLLVSQLSINEEDKPVEGEIDVTNFFSISEITKLDFDNGRVNAINYLVRDTAKIKKKKGVILLPCKNTVRKFVDYIPKPTDYDESIQTFEYLGQIPFLNAYLILGIYWEWYEYKLIDKTTGKEIATFNELPYISPDKKHILCISSNPYDMTADLSYYSITGMKIESIASMRFSNWMAADYSAFMYWGNDGTFNVGVNSIANFWNKEGDTNPPKQFIRFTLNN